MDHIPTSSFYRGRPTAARPRGPPPLAAVQPASALQNLGRIGTLKVWQGIWPTPGAGGAAACGTRFSWLAFWCRGLGSRRLEGEHKQSTRVARWHFPVCMVRHGREFARQKAAGGCLWAVHSACPGFRTRERRLRSGPPVIRDLPEPCRRRVGALRLRGPVWPAKPGRSSGKAVDREHATSLRSERSASECRLAGGLAGNRGGEVPGRTERVVPQDEAFVYDVFVDGAKGSCGVWLQVPAVRAARCPPTRHTASRVCRTFLRPGMSGLPGNGTRSREPCHPSAARTELRQGDYLLACAVPGGHRVRVGILGLRATLLARLSQQPAPDRVRLSTHSPDAEGIPGRFAPRRGTRKIMPETVPYGHMVLGIDRAIRGHG